MSSVSTASSPSYPWDAPLAQGPIQARIPIPGSKSITNRAYILAALSSQPSTIYGALRSRDTDLMLTALSAMGAGVSMDGTTIHIQPEPLTGAPIDCGLAGTVMRFIPPLATLSQGTVFLDGDEQARRRPLDTIATALRELGAHVEGDSLPLTIHGQGTLAGGAVSIDASASSQFISGLLLSAPAFQQGITVTHTGNTVPSLPHIEMTVSMLREAGIQVDTSHNQWRVHPGNINKSTWFVEPDLSNATPFLAAAAITEGTVRIPNWPLSTTQPGDQFRHILSEMGAIIEYDSHNKELICQGTGSLHGITIDMHDIGELTPTVAGLAALATSPSHLYGIAHLRGHETDRLHALATEITALGGKVEETHDGLIITPQPLYGGLWHSYADHRMATTGALIGLAVPGIKVENIETTSKTLPGFRLMWTRMLQS